MTSLSEWLRREQPDNTEPPSFYVPGCPRDWEEVKRTALRRARMTLEEMNDLIDTEVDDEIV